MALPAFLVACGGRGSPADAPTGLTVTGEDAQITLNWNVVSGVQYRVYCAPGTSVDNSSAFFNIPGHIVYDGATDPVLPPFTAGIVQNDQRYACTVDGRTNNGPAGPAAASLNTVPGSAGASWQRASPTGMTSGLRAVTAGRLTGLTADQFFAVGGNGVLMVTSDYASGSWAPVSVPSAVGNLNTVIVYKGTLFVAGSGGWLALRICKIGAQSIRVARSRIFSATAACWSLWEIRG